jgi:hypothetical protein
MALDRKEILMSMRRLAVLNQVILVLGSAMQLLAARRRGESPSGRRAAEILLSWSLPLNLGLLETYFFVGHVRRGRKRTSEDAGPSEQDKVRSELAVAHLAFSVLGLLSARFRGMFWLATVVGQAIFLVGVAAVRAREILKDKMYFFDVVMSLAHLGLLKAYDPLGMAVPPRPLWRRFFGA